MAATTSRETATGSSCSKAAAALGDSLCCGICYELLLDPVVGSCGHDFCKRCLDMWRSQQQQQGNNRVRCPVCRGSFAESFDKLGVCVRLRDMVELLFPERIAARRTDLVQQAALQNKCNTERLQQEDIPAAALGQFAEAQGRRRVHARRHHQQQPQQSVNPTAAAAAAAAAAAGALWSGFAAAAAAAGGPAFAGQGAQLPAGVQAAAGGLAGYAADPMLQLQAAMSAAGLHLQQLVHTGGQQQVVAAGVQQSVWPMRDVQFTMGWFEPRSSAVRSRAAGRISIRASGRHRCRRFG